MKYKVEWLSWYNLMSDEEIIKADNRKQAVQLFFKKTKNQLVPLNKIWKAKNSDYYTFSVVPVEVNENYKQWSYRWLTKIGKQTFLWI